MSQLPKNRTTLLDLHLSLRQGTSSIARGTETPTQTTLHNKCHQCNIMNNELSLETKHGQLLVFMTSFYTNSLQYSLMQVTSSLFSLYEIKELTRLRKATRFHGVMVNFMCQLG